MAIAGHLSRAMMERYSHIRMNAKRQAVEALSSRYRDPIRILLFHEITGIFPVLSSGCWLSMLCTKSKLPLSE